MKKNCVICDAEFETKRSNAKYCSMYCRNRRDRTPKGGHIDNVCVYCGDDFKSKRKAKWCSRLCKSRGEKLQLDIKSDHKYSFNGERRNPLGEASCRHCNDIFIKKSYKHQYCKVECKTAARVKIDKERRLAQREEIECAWCGKKVIPSHKLRKTCSGECAKQYRKRHKAERVKVHIIDKKCPTCGKADFKQWSNFNRHVRNCKEKTCVICGEMFFSGRNYTQTCGCRPLIKGKPPKGYPIERECAVCTSTFTAHFGKNLYCGRVCYDKHRLSIPKIALKKRVSDGVRKSLKYVGIKKTNRTFDLLDFTKEELRIHLESQFIDGMSWDNMDEWHIDHVRPIASFNFDSTDHPEFKECWALENLRPMWAVDNISKGSLWEGKRHRRKVIQ